MSSSSGEEKRPFNRVKPPAEPEVEKNLHGVIGVKEESRGRKEQDRKQQSKIINMLQTDGPGTKSWNQQLHRPRNLQESKEREERAQTTPRNLLNMRVEGHVLVKDLTEIPHGGAEGQSNAHQCN